MHCDKCEYLHIIQQPLRGKDGLYDLGKAECKKYDLITDFTHNGKFKKLTCPKGENNDSKRT